MDIDTRNGHVKHGGVREKGRKITNRVYTEEDYKEVG